MALIASIRIRQKRWALDRRGIDRRGITTIAHEFVRAGGRDGDEHRKTGIVIHGLMGAGKNLRTLAKDLLSTVTQRCPQFSKGWELVLVDLRNHGNSADLKHLNPPHNIQAAATDIAELVRSELPKWPDVIIGHSLGGKVALEFGERCATGRFGPSAVNPSQIWVLDSVPGKIDIEQNGEVERVLKSIKELPDPLPSRRWLVEHLVKKGFSKSLADWLGTNLRRVEASSEKMTWVFDVEGIYDMYLSYKQTNYWPFLESPPKGLDIGLVRAEKSDRWHPSLLSKLEDLANTSPKPGQGRVSYHVLERAGHWLHIDNPSGLIEILAPSFVRLASS